MRKWEFCFAMPPVKQTFLHVPLERFKDTSGATYSKVLNSFCHEAFSSPKFQQLYQQCLTLVVSGRAWAHLFSGMKRYSTRMPKDTPVYIFVYQQYKVEARNMYG